MALRGLEQSDGSSPGRERGNRPTETIIYARVRRNSGSIRLLPVMQGVEVTGPVDVDATAAYLQQLASDRKRGLTPHRARTRQDNATKKGSSVKALRRRGSWGTA